MEASNLEESDLKGMEVCSFGGTEMALPIDLIEQVNHGLARYNAKLSIFMNETRIYDTVKVLWLAAGNVQCISLNKHTCTDPKFLSFLL